MRMWDTCGFQYNMQKLRKLREALTIVSILIIYSESYNNIYILKIIAPMVRRNVSKKCIKINWVPKKENLKARITREIILKILYEGIG